MELLEREWAALRQRRTQCTRWNSVDELRLVSSVRSDDRKTLVAPPFATNASTMSRWIEAFVSKDRHPWLSVIGPIAAGSGLPPIILSIMAPPVRKNRHTSTRPATMKTMLR